MTAHRAAGLAEPDHVPRRRKVSSRIAEQLQRQILSGELPPETRLPAESDLATELGVSRTAVRDAMRTLATRGLITVRHGHGMAVAKPSDASFAEALILMLVRSELTVGDLIEARAQIEIEIFPAAAERCTAEDIDLLASALRRFQEAVEARNWNETALCHADVHLALLAATRYPALDIMLRPMAQILLLSSHPPRRRDAARLWEVEAHTAILDALRSRSRPRLRRAMQAHYEVMNPGEYRAQRAGLVRDSPAVRDLLSEVMDWGPPVSAASAAGPGMLGGDGRASSRRSQP
jgi:GntR family transcriptional regulator, transcriptional repressor for pyruvate dehydrogenase complex